MKPADITVVVTSCNRHDLLARTLESFRDHETEGRVARILVAEDGEADPGSVCARYGAEYFRSGQRLGQIAMIDRAYGMVATPYIFHLEDDWEFYRPGFMERSRAFLESDPSTLLVWLRAWNDTNGQPVAWAAPDRSHGVMAAEYGPWNGFTFNPGLRRLSEYRMLGSYGAQELTLKIFARNRALALPYEAQASQFYYERGYKAMILDEGGFVRHIGEDHHVAHDDDKARIPADIPRNAPCPCESGKKFKHCHGALT